MDVVKIRTQLTTVMVVFGIAALIISLSVIVAQERVARLDSQEELARSIELEADRLIYLSNDYLLYRESQQLDRWRSGSAALDRALDNISVETPDRRALVEAIRADRQRLGAVFDEIVAGTPAGPSAPAPDLESVRVSWSRLAVQEQGLVFDASRLSQALRDESEQMREQSILLVASLVGLFVAFLLTSYLLNFRRILASIAGLQEGTRIIGSGNLAHRLPETRDDEIGELARSFNRMTTDLRSVTASRAELEQEIDHRTQAEAQLRESLEHLEQKEAELRQIALFLTESPFPVMRVDTVGEVLYANPTGAMLLEGWGMDANERFSPRFLAVVDEAMELDAMRDLEVTWGSTVYSIAVVPVPDQHYVNLYFSDITRRKRAEEALAQQAERLRRSNEDLERFAYVSSHDLQEPIRSIVSFSQLLERRYGGRLDADADEYIGFIVEAGTRMQALIRDLLQLSRVSTRAGEPRPTESGAVLESVLRDISPVVEASDAVVERGPMPRVMADPTQLGQIFSNLISNALKFCRPGVQPRVRLSAEREGRFWRFAVEDNGIGIEAEYFDRIFVIFQRLHTRDHYDGTGIGLALVKRIVEQHGGRTWVESEPGRGSTFYFTLPGADAGPPAR